MPGWLIYILLKPQWSAWCSHMLHISKQWSYFSTVFQNAENIPVVNMLLVFPDVVNAIVRPSKSRNVFVFFVKQINSCPHTNEKVLCIYVDVHILLLYWHCLKKGQPMMMMMIIIHVHSNKRKATELSKPNLTIGKKLASQ